MRLLESSFDTGLIQNLHFLLNIYFKNNAKIYIKNRFSKVQSRNANEYSMMRGASMLQCFCLPQVVTNEFDGKRTLDTLQ